MKNQKGFYYALYSCLGIVLVGTAMLALYLTNSNNELAPVDALGAGNLIPPPVVEIPTANIPQPGVQEAGIREFFNREQEQQDQQAQPQEQPQEEPVPQPTPQPAPQAEIEQEVIPVFNHFNEANVMIWPVLGEVVMDYSSDQFIFDSTLNLYRTNDTMNIAANAGTTVRAAAEGIVTQVFYERREGNSLTIDHGNGWTTTYSQLDNITVSEGDVVATGQIIGEVSPPSIFTSALGDNLGFRVTNEEGTVNPLVVLQQ